MRTDSNVKPDVHNILPFSPAPARRVADTKMAREIMVALKFWMPISWDRIKPLVHAGQVLLEGTVAWPDQREPAEGAVRSVKGVVKVENRIRSYLCWRPLTQSQSSASPWKQGHR